VLINYITFNFVLSVFCIVRDDDHHRPNGLRWMSPKFISSITIGQYIAADNYLPLSYMSIDRPRPRTISFMPLIPNFAGDKSFADDLILTDLDTSSVSLV
jgi:hypothetical protein